VERRKAKSLADKLKKLDKEKPKHTLSLKVLEMIKVEVSKTFIEPVEEVKPVKKEKSEQYFKLLAENDKLFNRANKKMYYQLNTEMYRAKDNIWHYENKEKVAKIEKESRERKKNT
jgi:hypothetical protein